MDPPWVYFTFVAQSPTDPDSNRGSNRLKLTDDHKYYWTSGSSAYLKLRQYVINIKLSTWKLTRSLHRMNARQVQACMEAAASLLRVHATKYGGVRPGLGFAADFSCRCSWLCHITLILVSSCNKSSAQLQLCLKNYVELLVSPTCEKSCISILVSRLLTGHKITATLDEIVQHMIDALTIAQESTCKGEM